MSKLLIPIVIIALVLRLFSLSSVPPAASLDEVSIGYNAYSILKTGADEYGTKFPLVLRAYDDFRPALYVYFVLPFVWLFGLSAFAVRFPSVVLSILTVYATYYLVKSFSKQLVELKLNEKNAEMLALISALLLAISPWHIYISRLGHEANLALAFFVFGLTFFFYQRIFLSILFFAISFMSYQSEKIFIPLFVLVLFILYRKEILKMKKTILFGFVISLLFLVPFLQQTFTSNALIRYQATSLFSNSDAEYNRRSILYAQAVANYDVWGKIIHNRRFVTAQLLLSSYISHFNPKWLFLNSSNDKHKVPGLGLMYLWELPFLIAGIIVLLRQRGKIKYLILPWILFSIIPAAITTQAPHAMRTYTILPSLQFLTGVGIVTMFVKIKHLGNFAKPLLYVFPILVLAASMIYFSHQYYTVFPQSQSSSFQYGLSNAIPFALDHQSGYKKIVFSNTNALYQSYMFFLFYTKYDPLLYQKQGGTKSGGFREEHKIGKYEYRLIDWQNEKTPGLYVGNIHDFPFDTKVLRTFYERDGQPTILAVEKK